MEESFDYWPFILQPLWYVSKRIPTAIRGFFHSWRRTARRIVLEVVVTQIPAMIFHSIGMPLELTATQKRAFPGLERSPWPMDSDP